MPRYALLTLLFLSPAFSDTISVRQDGTGDFDSIQAALSADGKLGPKVGGSIQFVLTGGHGGDSTWVIDCKQSKVSRGAGKADCTVTLSEENFMALATGKLQGMQAFMAGKMKVKGNMMLAQKFGALAGPGAKSKL